MSGKSLRLSSVRWFRAKSGRAVEKGSKKKRIPPQPPSDHGCSSPIFCTQFQLLCKAMKLSFLPQVSHASTQNVWHFALQLIRHNLIKPKSAASCECCCSLTHSMAIIAGMKFVRSLLNWSIMAKIGTALFRIVPRPDYVLLRSFNLFSWVGWAFRERQRQSCCQMQSKIASEKMANLTATKPKTQRPKSHIELS